MAYSPGCPPYSPSPSESDIVLSTCTWSYNTKHMNISLKAGDWGLHQPAYGSKETIQGSVMFSGSQDSVKSVTVSLEARSTPCVSGSVETILSHSVALDVKESWKDLHPFSISIPSEITLRSRTFPTPPSFYFVDLAASFHISFFIKFRMTRQRSRLRKKETITIPILYLPKSYPKAPPLTHIPRPSARDVADMSASCLHLFDRVQTTPLSPYWPSSRRKPSERRAFDRCINFSLPAIKSFASGDEIPYAISLVFPEQPALAKILAPSIKVVLFKRILTWRRRRRFCAEYSFRTVREWPITTGRLWYQNEYKEGTMMYRGFVEAGKVGQERSWTLDEVVNVQFILRVTVNPPKCLQGHIPEFRHDEIIELTTDQWRPTNYGVLDGIPALGLMRASEPEITRVMIACPPM